MEWKTPGEREHAAQVEQWREERSLRLEQAELEAEQRDLREREVKALERQAEAQERIAAVLEAFHTNAVPVEIVCQ